MATTCKRVCSAFVGDRGSKLHTVHLAQIIQETTPKCGLILKQAQKRPAVVPERKQTTEMHLICVL